jgi:hypothetical protein
VHSQWNFDIIASTQPVTYKLKGKSMKHTRISVETLAIAKDGSYRLFSNKLFSIYKSVVIPAVWT